MAKVAVVVTVLNEEKTLGGLLDSLAAQTVKPREIIIVDGGSTDKTWALLLKAALRLKHLRVWQKRGNRSVGRNLAIASAKSPLIAITDAGCIPDPDWLEEIIKPFSQRLTQVVSGYYRGLPQTVFEKCLLPYVLVMPDRIGGEFFPSASSMAIRRALWRKAGGFDENLSYNEDYAFAHTLKKTGVEFVFAPKAIVGWLPRKNLSQAAGMFLRFAIGDVQAGILRPKVKLLALRYYLFFFLFFVNHLFILLALPYILWAILKNFKYVKDVRALFWLPLLQLTADATVLFGTLVGWLSRPG